MVLFPLLVFITYTRIVHASDISNVLPELSYDPAVGSALIVGQDADSFAATLGGHALDINTVIQKLIDDGHVKVKADMDTTIIVGHQYEKLLSTLNFDLLAEETKRKIDNKEPLDFWVIFLILLGVLCSYLSHSILLLVIRYVGLSALGFTAGGIAAAWQACLGNVAAGSLFALLQSIGAGGVGGVVYGAAVGLGAVFARFGCHFM